MSVTAKIEVPRKKMTWVTDAIVSRVNGDYEFVVLEEESRFRVLTNAGEGTVQAENRIP